MRRIAIAFVVGIFLLAAIPAQASQKLQGWCEDGGALVQVAGLTSSTLTRIQRSYVSAAGTGCTVTVYAAGTTNLSTIYSDNSSTPKANPFTAASSGQWFFYALAGHYDVKFSGGGIQSPFTLGDFTLDDIWTRTSAGIIYPTAITDVVNIGGITAPTGTGSATTIAQIFKGLVFTSAGNTTGPAYGPGICTMMYRISGEPVDPQMDFRCNGYIFEDATTASIMRLNGVTDRVSIAPTGLTTYNEKSTFEVNGNMSVGAAGGVTAGPTNGLYVTGRTEIGSNGSSGMIYAQGTAGGYVVKFTDDGSTLDFSLTTNVLYMNRAAGFTLNNQTSNIRIQAAGASSGVQFNGTTTAFELPVTMASTLNVSGALVTDSAGTATFAGQVVVTNMNSASTGDYTCFNTSTKQLTQGTATCTLSSARYKHDFASLQFDDNGVEISAIDKLMRVPTYSFVRNDHPELGRMMGVKAEDMALIEPRLVIFDGNGKPDKFLYENFTAWLALALQEATVESRTKMNDLQLQIDTLKRKNQ